MIGLTDLKCPQCGGHLAMEDMNVAADMVLCRSCNRAAKFSEIIQEVEDDGILDEVPACLKIAKTVKGLEVTHKTSKWRGFSILFFTVFWNGIVYAVMLSALNKKDFAFFDLLFFIPFILAGLGMVCASVYELFGGMRLALQPGRGELFRGVGNIGRRQKFVLEKGSRISLAESKIEQTRGAERKRLLKIVVPQPDGRPLEFGASIDEHTQQYLVALLRQMRA